MTHLPFFRIFPPAFLVLACLQLDSVYAVTVVCCPNTIMHLLCGSYFAQIAIKSNEKEWFHFEKKVTVGKMKRKKMRVYVKK